MYLILRKSYNYFLNGCNFLLNHLFFQNLLHAFIKFDTWKHKISIVCVSIICLSQEPFFFFFLRSFHIRYFPSKSKSIFLFIAKSLPLIKYFFLIFILLFHRPFGTISDFYFQLCKYLVPNFNFSCCKLVTNSIKFSFRE